MTHRDRPSPNRPASETLRRQIMAELENRTMTARDLSKILRAAEKEVLGHLEHVAKSARPPNRLILSPSFCNQCQFTFSDRRKFSSPADALNAGMKGLPHPPFALKAARKRERRSYLRLDPSPVPWYPLKHTWR